MRLRTITAIAGAVTLISPTGTAAQLPAPTGCGSVANAQGYLREFEKYFRDDEMAEYRGTAIVQLTPTASQEVVTQIGVCQAVLHAASRMFRQYEPRWSQIEQAGYDFTVLRYGGYYAILVKYEIDPYTGQHPHYIPLLIFRSHGLSYVMTILV
jgi:hypothetical protein